MHILSHVLANELIDDCTFYRNASNDVLRSYDMLHLYYARLEDFQPRSSAHSQVPRLFTSAFTSSIPARLEHIMESEEGRNFLDSSFERCFRQYQDSETYKQVMVQQGKLGFLTG